MPSARRRNGSLNAGPIATAAAAAKVKPAYDTPSGTAYHGTFEAFLQSKYARDYAGKVQLIFTSPPFPLNRKKRYGNLRGDEYARWLARFAPAFRELLQPKGSIVIELGNAWEPGLPVMSTLALRALLRFLDEGGFYLCQQFVCYNPARLPTPAQWVNVKRMRVKDAFTHLWWMSPSPEPKASNRRVLKEYSLSMLKLLARGKYNAGRRPSQHHIGEKSFLKDNNGAIPSNVLTAANTKAKDPYQVYCRAKGLEPHPARMPEDVPDFFIRFLTEEGDLILDPFAGSNTTGSVAERLNREWVSVEPNLDYLSGSKVRFGDGSGARRT